MDIFIELLAVVITLLASLALAGTVINVPFNAVVIGSKFDMGTKIKAIRISLLVIFLCGLAAAGVFFGISQKFYLLPVSMQAITIAVHIVIEKINGGKNIVMSMINPKPENKPIFVFFYFSGAVNVIAMLYVAYKVTGLF